MEPQIDSLLRWILIWPLVGFGVNLFLGRRLPEKGVGAMGAGMIGLSFVFGAITFFHLISLEPHSRLLVDRLYHWIAADSFRSDFSLQIDPLSMVMVLIITGVGFLIHLYSVGYMHGDKGFSRYFAYLNLFVFFMLLLVMADNLLLLFVGWEGVGLCSYLLIGFWYEEKINTNAGNKAFIVNRIGDFGFLVGIFLLFWSVGSVGHWTLRFTELEKWVPALDPTVITAAALLLFVGACGKSAQIPLYVWLPDAMQGPTPVSALIHAATMVTAGVYMVTRLHFLYLLSPLALSVVAGVGAATAFFAATIGLVQRDIKRVLAYSTISQLGYMFLALGVGAFSAGIFHLVTHAFFKALLFLGAGSVMHALGGRTDMAQMGGLRKKLPWTHGTMLVGTVAIAGIPPLSGFISKDEILWNAFASPWGSPLLWGIGIVTAGLTALYMFRLLFLTFYGTFRGEAEVLAHAHESPKMMTLPLAALALLSAIAGFWGLPHLFDFAHWGNQFHHFLEPVVGEGPSIDLPLLSLEWTLVFVSVGIAAAGLFLARHFFLARPDAALKIQERFARLHRLLWNKYFVDEVYNRWMVRPLVSLSDRFLWRFFDAKIVDGAVNGAGSLVRSVAQRLRAMQTGFVQSYAFSILLGLVLILLYIGFVI
ncbi:MAG: NADH-quinone oxidoreductase subunit L [Deltaproteobacteria bacterium]|nr:NADH-quinone oxidoreductase subunit L [Deltaproteobacteria bacterium]